MEKVVRCDEFSVTCMIFETKDDKFQSIGTTYYLKTHVQRKREKFVKLTDK